MKSVVVLGLAALVSVDAVLAQSQRPSTLADVINTYGVRASDVRAALKAGADPDELGGHAFSPITPLIAAIEQDNLPVVRVLVAHGARLEHAVTGKTPLDAAMGRSDDILQFLLARGANPNGTTTWGDPALYMLITTYHDHDKAVMLLAAGADPRGTAKDGTTVLMAAAQQGMARLVQRLLAAGAPVDARGPYGITALMRARTVPVAEILLRSGADKNARDVNGKSVLRHQSGAVGDLLMKRGATP